MLNLVNQSMCFKFNTRSPELNADNSIAIFLFCADPNVALLYLYASAEGVYNKVPQIQSKLS